MKNSCIKMILGLFFLSLIVIGAGQRLPPATAENAPSVHVSVPASYTGSVSCRKCHEKFYQLWAPSHHGLAMQPYTAELARNKLSPQTEDIAIGRFPVSCGH